MNQIQLQVLNEILPPSSSYKSAYTWLLTVDLLLFCSWTLTTYTSYKKLAWKAESNKTDSNYNFTPKFLKALILANGIRTLSLVFIIIWYNPLGNNPRSWWNSWLHVVPSLVFVSAYMYLATFLSDWYYISIDSDNKLIKPLLLFIVIFGYIIISISALLTFWFQYFKVIMYISEFLTALLYWILGTVIIYYGRKVSDIFKQRRNDSTINNTSCNNSSSSFLLNVNEWEKRLTFLSFSIGGLFLLKGWFGFLTAFTVINPKSYINIYDFFWFLILEITPTVIFIYINKDETAANSSNGKEFPRSSEWVNEWDTNFSVRESSFVESYRPPFIKE